MKTRGQASVPRPTIEWRKKTSAAPRAPPIPLSKEYLRDFYERNHARRLSLFGSVLTERFRPESDIDVLVKFEAKLYPGLSVWLAWRSSFGRSSAGKSAFALRWSVGMRNRLIHGYREVDLEGV